MGRPIDDLVGKTFGRLTVVRFDKKVGRRAHFWCRCSCGKELSVRGSALKTGDTYSCGCSREPGYNAKHGMRFSREYKSWSQAKYRCRNKKCHAYPEYGGRGIKFSEAWNEFLPFYEHMGPCPEGMTLDRKDVNGNYEPGNCRWATDDEQQQNRRVNTLNVELVRQIREDYAAGMRQADIARNYNIGVSNVWGVVHNKLWKAAV